MRPLTQTSTAKAAAAFPEQQGATLAVCLLAALLVVASISGCSQSSGSGEPPPPPPQIQVIVSPKTGTVLLGNTQIFSASVSNTTNTAVTWSVNGVPGGNAASGIISASGIYTAPGDLPTPASVQVAATSAADPTKSDTAAVSITSDIVASISPKIANVELGALQPFGASISSAGHPDATVRWSISGGACPNECGGVDTHGNFTAPQILPASASVTLTAQSIADPSKQASASITITSNFTLTISAPASRSE